MSIVIEMLLVICVWIDRAHCHCYGHDCCKQEKSRHDEGALAKMNRKDSAEATHA